MKIQKRFLTVLTAAIIFASLSVPVMAESQTSDQLMLQKQLHLLMDQIRLDTGMSPEEVEALRFELRNALRAAGEGGPVRAMVRAANADGCQGECLREALRQRTRTQWRHRSGQNSGQGSAYWFTKDGKPRSGGSGSKR